MKENGTMNWLEQVHQMKNRDIRTIEQHELQERIDVMQQAMDRLTFKIENYTSHMVPSENKLREFK